MKTVYELQVFHGETNEENNAWSKEIYTSMKAACRYGERIYRKFGHKYRVIKKYPISYSPW